MAMLNTLPLLQEVVKLIETSEDTSVKKEVEKRRMRLGGPGGGIEETRRAVGREVWASSKVISHGPYILAQTVTDLLLHPSYRFSMPRS